MCAVLDCSFPDKLLIKVRVICLSALIEAPSSWRRWSWRSAAGGALCSLLCPSDTLQIHEGHTLALPQSPPELRRHVRCESLACSAVACLSTARWLFKSCCIARHAMSSRVIYFQDDVVIGVDAELIRAMLPKFLHEFQVFALLGRMQHPPISTICAEYATAHCLPSLVCCAIVSCARQALRLPAWCRALTPLARSWRCNMAAGMHRCSRSLEPRSIHSRLLSIDYGCTLFLL